MQRRTLKQKCLAWLLSLAVAMTFIPMTAGIAFANDPTPDMFINLAKANGSQFDDDEVKVYVNLEAPWQDGDSLVTAQVATGQEMKPVVSNLNCKWAGTFTEANNTDPNGQPYFTVDYGTGNWTDPGDYTLKVIANESAAPFEAETKGVKHIVKFKGTYELPCKILSTSKDLATSTVTFSEGTVNNKTGFVEVPYDGKLHELVPSEVKDLDGNVINPAYYDVTYPSSTANAYKKVGLFDIVITAKEGNEGGYVGSITKTLSITDVVTDITVYSQAGKNGNRVQKKVFKFAKWNDYSLSTPIEWGYKGDTWTTKNYIPMESLLAAAGTGEKGKFNDKDIVWLWSNSDPEIYTNPYLPNSKDYIFGEIKKQAYTATGEKIIDQFGDESTIPAFLVLDTDNESSRPMMAVGYMEGNKSPGGYFFCKPVSEISLVSMDIAGLNTSVANGTYNGKAQTPVVTVKDGDVTVPVTVAYSNNTNAGTGTVKVTAKEDSAYYGTVTKTFKINKAANPLTVKAKDVKVKRKAVKKKAQKLAASKVLTVSGAQGSVTYAKTSGSKKLSITNAGKVTVKKKTKKGTYKMNVKVTAAGNANYNAATKTVTVKIRVK